MSDPALKPAEGDTFSLSSLFSAPPPWESQRSVSVAVPPGSCGADCGPHSGARIVPFRPCVQTAYHTFLHHTAAPTAGPLRTRATLPPRSSPDASPVPHITHTELMVHAHSSKQYALNRTHTFGHRKPQTSHPGGDQNMQHQ